MFVMTLGSLVKDRRQYLGLTQEELANEVTTARSQIEAIENGRVIQPAVPLMNALARALRIPVEDLLRAQGFALQLEAETIAEAEERMAAEMAEKINEAIRFFRRRPPTAENG